MGICWVFLLFKTTQQAKNYPIRGNEWKVLTDEHLYFGTQQVPIGMPRLTDGLTDGLTSRLPYATLRVHKNRCSPNDQAILIKHLNYVYKDKTTPHLHVSSSHPTLNVTQVDVR